MTIFSKADVARGHHVGPGEGFFHGGIAAAVEELQGKAVACPEEQAQKDLLAKCQARFSEIE